MVGHKVQGAVEACASAQEVDILDLFTVSYAVLLRTYATTRLAHAYPFHGGQARVSQSSETTACDVGSKASSEVFQSQTQTCYMLGGAVQESEGLLCRGR